MAARGERRGAIAVAVGAAVVLTSAIGAKAAAQTNGQGRAEEILRAMASRLAESKTLKVNVVRELDAGLARETGLPERATIEVSVMRPNRLRARSVAPDDVRVFLADGQRVTIFDEKTKVYATAPAPGSIDEMSRRIEQRFGFAPPLGEVLSNDPYQAIRTRARTMSYGGVSTVDGQRCHRLLLRGEAADAELFVSVEDELPCRLVATFKDTAGSPKLRMSFSDWQLGVPIEASDFAFSPPKGAEEVEMVPVEALEPPGAGKPAPAPRPPSPAAPPGQGSQDRGEERRMR